jgi:leucyl/phenylalanyl-tRNA--protein transferase
MSVFRLHDEIVFPAPELADDDGLLAVGGDLSMERLVLAYSMGIFPWYSDDSPILWWSPDPRLVLMPEDLKVSRSLRQTIRKEVYRVTFDMAFDRVIRNCAEVSRKGEAGTWITEEMILAYCRLHREGHAHSIESWYGDELAGGLYGVAIGGVFFGESMFSLRSDASKVAFVKIVQQLAENGFKLIDCQMTTRHLVSLGAKEISRRNFLMLLDKYVHMTTPAVGW